MTGRLEGKAALVTGAAQGNGRQIALAFAREGANVVVSDVDAAGAEATLRLLPAGTNFALSADVSSVAEVECLVDRAVDALGRLDVLVNNAGIWRPGTVETLTPGDWDDLMAVNVRSVFLCSKFAIPHLARAGGGSIINLSSLAGIQARSGSVLYAASKHAVVGISRCMALDHAPQGIRVNCICPGLIDTAMGQRVLTAMGPENLEEARRDFLAAVPLGRLGRAEDVATIAVHLASDEAAWVTGTEYVLDGGSGLTRRR
jgi:NAD(P)-dependent dehydrogenase (short-subunit alcohol dehydrogenase family)